MVGSSISIRRPLRARVAAASTVAFLALMALVCGVLPNAYRIHSREALRRDAVELCRALAVSTKDGPQETLPPAAVLETWTTAHPELDSVHLLDAGGTEIAHWPAHSYPWTGAAPGDSLVETATHIVTARPIRENDADAPLLAVRVSTASHRADLDSVGWLFLSVFLFAGGVFSVLTGYLTRVLVEPLEDIARAASRIANGERFVEVPSTGDDEIDRLGKLITELARTHRPDRSGPHADAPLPASEGPGRDVSSPLARTRT